HTLQATELVNEAYLKIFGGSDAEFQDRAHFLAFASRLMRSILVDYARARNAVKRGGDLQRVAADTSLEVAVDDSDSADRLISLLDLNAAVDALSKEHPSAARAIEIGYLGGQTAEQNGRCVGR